MAQCNSCGLHFSVDPIPVSKFKVGDWVRLPAGAVLQVTATEPRIYHGVGNSMVYWSEDQLSPASPPLQFVVGI